MLDPLLVPKGERHKDIVLSDVIVLLVIRRYKDGTSL